MNKAKTSFRITSLIVAAALAFSLIACDNNTTNGEDDGIPGANLAEKMSWLQSNAQSGDDFIIEVNAKGHAGVPDAKKS